MWHSSIFSFESLRTVRPRLPLTIVAVLALLVVAEGACRRLPQRWFVDPWLGTARIVFIEDHILPTCDSPKVVFLGSSRGMFGVNPRLLDRRLGLPDRSCVNCSILTGGPELFLKFYHRNRRKLKSAELVILNVDEWHFVGPPTFSAGGEPPTMFIDEVFPMRERYLALVDNLLMMTGFSKARTLGLMVDENNQAWSSPKQDFSYPADLKSYRTIIRGSYYREDECICPYKLAMVTQLAKMVHEDGGRFVIIQMPNRAAFHREVLSLYGPEFRRRVAAVRALDLSYYLFEHPAECGLSDDSYTDGMHLRPTGADQFTCFLADWIRRENLLKTGE